MNRQPNIGEAQRLEFKTGVIQMENNCKDGVHCWVSSSVMSYNTSSFDGKGHANGEEYRTVTETRWMCNHCPAIHKETETRTTWTKTVVEGSITQ